MSPALTGTPLTSVSRAAYRCPPHSTGFSERMSDRGGKQGRIVDHALLDVRMMGEPPDDARE
jgi:hypothetical protein